MSDRPFTDEDVTRLAKWMCNRHCQTKRSAGRPGRWSKIGKVEQNKYKLEARWHLEAAFGLKTGSTL